MRSVALVDYGSGNLPSALKALLRAAEAVGDTRVEATDDPEVISRADAVVLPGVGAFAACMDALRARAGVIEAMETAVRHRGVPFLGICVGLQLMSDQGREFGLTPGLGWIGGEVRRLEPAGGLSGAAETASPQESATNRKSGASLRSDRTETRSRPALKLPHMGWNSIERPRGPLFDGLAGGDHMYFTHAYAIFPHDEAVATGWTDHGGPFVSAVTSRQPRRGAVPPRKVAGRGRPAAAQLSGMAAMILYPAIDLKDGQCVRVVRGDLATATVFNTQSRAPGRSLGRRRLPLAARGRSRTARSRARWSTARRSRPSSRPSACRCSWAAASAPWPTWSGGSIAASPA